jgi:hypothetical protein
MRAIRTLGFMLLAAVGAHAGECAVTVALTNPNLASPAVLAKAKAVAAGIFAGIDVDVRWTAREKLLPSHCTTRIDAQLEIAAGPGERPSSLAYTALGEGSDRRLHIYFDRVAAMVPNTALGTLVGHVLAHEIAHILEGVPRHSDAGVMKAQWGRKDLRELAYHPLRFQLVDEALIHAGLATLTNEAAASND